jgi:hypothetical protein
MRGFFVLLLITNLLFLGWQFWLAPENGVLAPEGSLSVSRGGLTLLAELDGGRMPPVRTLQAVEDTHAQTTASPVELIAAEDKVEEVATEQAPATLVSVFCYQSTQLETLADAKSLQQTLAKMGINATKRETVQTQKTNYWVMLAADKDPAKVNAVIDTLKQKHVKDFFVVRSGRYENAISLGVYSTRERAELRYKEIRGLKSRLPKPEIEALELPTKRLVVSFQLDSSAIPEGMALLLDASKEPHLKKISCN